MLMTFRHYNGQAQQLHTEASAANMVDSGEGESIAKDLFIGSIPGTASTPRPGSQMQKSKSQVALGKKRGASNYHLLLNRLYRESKVIELKKMEAA